MAQSNRAIYYAQYNIPKVNLNSPARQNRSLDGIIKITPGMTEIIEVWIGNVDGISINLANFTVRFIAFYVARRDGTTISQFDNRIVFSKNMEVINPYDGKFLMEFSDSDTLAMSRPSISALRWSLFMINSDNQVFPATVTSSGSRYGQLLIDLESGLPTSDLILSTAG